MPKSESKQSPIKGTILLIATIAGCLGISFLIIVHPINQGSNLERRLDFKSASELYIKALNNPFYSIDPLIYTRLAFCNRQMNNFEAAYDYIDKGFAIQNAHPIYSTLSNLWNDPIGYKLYVEQGYIFYREKNYEDAIKSFNNAITINKGGKAYSGLAAVYESLGDDKKVNEFYSKALKVTSGSRKELVLHERAIYHRNQGRDNEAKADLTKAVALHDCPQAYYERAKLYKKEGNLKKSLMDFNSAIRYQSTEKYYHARALLKKEMKDYKGALEDFKKANSLNTTCKTLDKDKALIEELLESASKTN